MSPVSKVITSSAPIIEKKPAGKPVVKASSEHTVTAKPTIVTPPKDKNLSTPTLPDDFKKQVSFKGKIDPKKTPHKKEEHHSTAHDIQHAAHSAHSKHTKYEIAVSAQKIVSKTSNVITKGSRVLLVSGEIGQAASSTKATQTVMQAVKGTGVATAVVGKTLGYTAKVLHTAHHASEATQVGALKSTATVLSKVGAAKAAAKVTSLIPATAHAVHGATSTVKAAATLAKVASTTKTAATIARTASVASKVTLVGAKALGRVMPGVGFVAGMAGAGFAINDAVNAKTTAGKVAHSARAVLSATAGVASFVPGVGTAVGLVATGAEIGLGYAAKKLGWN